MTLARIAVAALVFAGALVTTFPADAVVRWAVARATPPGLPALAFERARLRPWGMRLEAVSVAGSDGSPMAIADWLTFTPSLTALLVHGTAVPCRIRAAACGGTVDARVARDGGLAVGWRDVEVARCGPAARLGGLLEGAFAGQARVRVDDTGDDALAPGGTRVAFSDLAVRAPDLDVTGFGTLGLGRAARETSLDLALRIVSGPAAPPGLRALLAEVPAADASGARRIAVHGTLADPRVDAIR